MCLDVRFFDADRNVRMVTVKLSVDTEIEIKIYYNLRVNIARIVEFSWVFGGLAELVQSEPEHHSFNLSQLGML